MKSKATGRGFVRVEHAKYPPQEPENVQCLLLQESSAIGDYEDSMDNPGSSYLWVGDNHHLNREQVAEMISRMQYWLDTKRLQADE
jgi:hypothetical protein